VRALAALASGLLFGVGLAVGHMTDPAVVLGFLDVAGDWNATLAFVMGGALAVTAAGYRWVLRRERPLFEPGFQLPTRRDVDARLVGGAAVFGLGWGLVGFCPGPALAALASGLPGVFVFVAALAAGSLFARLTLARPGAR
jgi:uncharacterized membrane protein YedE/YeeE